MLAPVTHGKVRVRMTTARSQTPARGGQGGAGGGMLLELVDRILDKGIVIDAWARVSILSIEVLTIEARVVVASVETYLRYAEAIGNTALASAPAQRSVQQARGAQGGGAQQPQLGGQQGQALPAPQPGNLMPQQLGQQFGQQQPQPAQPMRPQPQQTQPPMQPTQPAQPQQPQPFQPQQPGQPSATPPQ